MVLSVNFYGYERIQIAILVIFRNLDFSELVLLISLMIRFLDVQSEYSKYNIQFEEVSIDVLDIEF